MLFKLVGLLAVLCLIISAPAQNQQIIVHSEFVNTAQQQDLSPQATFMARILSEIMDRAELDYELIKLPGARTFAETVRTPNTFAIPVYRLLGLTTS